MALVSAGKLMGPRMICRGPYASLLGQGVKNPLEVYGSGHMRGGPGRGSGKLKIYKNFTHF
jgi:hypothetical protein